jgi:predicted metal-dependent hydrolase
MPRGADSDPAKQQTPAQPPLAPRRPAALPPPESRSIALGGATIAYTLRVSARARRISLRVSPAKGLEVVLPRGASITRAEALLREKADWVRRTLDRMRRVSPLPQLPPLQSGRILPFSGRPLTLALAAGAPHGRFRAECVGDILHLRVSALDEETARAALVAWYRRQAATVFAERLQLLNTFGFRYGRVSVKEQKSRWGSCSRAGNLNFNWRLLLAPLPVLDYVVVHELAHLAEHNHGPRFWALVAAVCPDYRPHRRWLREHGHELSF